MYYPVDERGKGVLDGFFKGAAMAVQPKNAPISLNKPQVTLDLYGSFPDFGCGSEDEFAKRRGKRFAKNDLAHTLSVRDPRKVGMGNFNAF